MNETVRLANEAQQVFGTQYIYFFAAIGLRKGAGAKMQYDLGGPWIPSKFHAIIYEQALK